MSHSATWDDLAVHQGPSGPYLVISDEHLFDSLDLTGPGLEQVRATAEAERYDAACAAWGDYWRERPAPVWVFDPDRYVEAMRRDLGWMVPVVVDRADQVVACDFRHATYRPVPAGRSFDWAAGDGDTAYIGFHYFFWTPCLGRAHLLTGDDRYAETFREVICSWHDALPELDIDRVVWNQQLGASLRMTYSLENYFLCRASPAFTPELHRKMLNCLLGHARYVHDQHLREYTPWNGQNSGLAWLICFGTMLPEFRQADGFREQAVALGRRHILENFRDDGGHDELCTQYHITGLRDLSLAARLLRRNGQDLLLADPEVRDRFRRAFEWLLDVSTPTGQCPALNSGVYDTEWLVYMGLGAELFDSAACRWAVRQFVQPGYLPIGKDIASAFWQVDETFARAVTDAEAPAEPPDRANCLLPASGFAVFRDGWSPESLYLILDAGAPWGGHGYPGKLSFILWGHGAPLALQPGSPASYSLPVYREWCRQTLSHNTVLVNGHSPDAPFTAIIDAWHDQGEVAWARAHTDVYQPTDEVTHERTVVHRRGEYFLIVDRLRTGAKPAELTWLFHCPQPLEVGKDRRATSPAGRPGVLLVPAEPKRITQVVQGTGHAAVPVDYDPAAYQPQDAWRDDLPYLGYVQRVGPHQLAEYAILVLPFAADPPSARLRRVAGDAFEVEVGHRCFRHDEAGRPEGP